MAQLKDLLVNGSARVIGNLFANLNGNVLNFGVCSTAAATAAKTVTTNGTFELITGSKILVLFSETDTSNAPTLNVNGTGAKSIKVNASDGVPKGFLTGQQYYWFAYDGSAWRIAGGGTTQIAPIQYGGTNNDSFTANRPLFFNGTKIIGSTDNYINDTSLAINKTSITSGYNFEVNGKSLFDDSIQIESSKAILFKNGAGGTTTSTPTGLTYGRLQGYGTFAINADTDNSKTEYVILTAGHGMSSSIQDGFYVGYSEVGSYLTTKIFADTYFLNGKSYFGAGSTDQKYYIDTANNDTTSGDAELRNLNVHTLGIRTHAGAGEGISLQGGYKKNDFPDFGLAYADTGNGAKYGDVQGDWATYFLIKQENNPQRGWIWRGRDMSAASDIAGSLSSRGVFTTRAVAANDTYIAFPQGGTISYQDNSKTGMLVIKLPQIKTDTMLRFNVEIYTHEGSKKNLATYHVGGYCYNNSAVWAHTQGYSEGIGNLSNLTIRFGLTADSAYITIGEIDTIWSYPKVAITNLIIGHSNATVEKWAYGWQLSILNANPCTTIANTITSPKNQSEYTGMNLFLGTQYMDEWTGDNELTGLAQTYCRGKKVSIGSSAAAADKDIKSSNTVLLESSTWYTLSFYAKANKSVALSSFLGVVAEAYSNTSVITPNAATGQVQHQVTNTWNRFWIAFKTTGSTQTDKTIIVLKLPADQVDTNVTVCLPKLEKGLIPTDWSRNPADAVHLFGASGDTSYLYNGGGYNSSYNNLILHGTAPNGTSGIAFTSQVGNTSINVPSDRAFIQYHPHGITTATAEGTEPTEATSGENGRFVIGVGNDSTDQIWLQAPDSLGVKHQMGANSYTIADTNNTNWTTWNNGTTAGPTLSINFAGEVKTSPAIPKASSSISGIVTTDAQTFGGDKTFNGNVTHNGIVNIGNISNTSYKLYVNGTSYFSNNLTVDGTIVNKLGKGIEGNGQYSYCKLFTIITNKSYINKPFVFEISGRGKSFSQVEVMFVNSPSADPNIASFKSNCENCFFYKKVDINTWEIYAQYSESWGCFYIHRITGYCTQYTVNLTLENLSALPEGATRVTVTANLALAKKLTIQANGTQKGQFNNSADVTVNLGNVAQDFTGANSGNPNNINADTFAGMTRQQWLNTVYPVGSIYMSVSATSPATLFGGTWESLGGRFLIGQDGTYTAGSTGGSATHAHTTPATTTGGTAITIAQMPSHAHDYELFSGSPGTSGNDAAQGKFLTALQGADYRQSYTCGSGKSREVHLYYTGGGEAHTHSQVATTTSAASTLPPYLAVYMWKRTA